MKGRKVRKAFRLIASAAILVAIAALAINLCSSGPRRQLPKSAACAVVSNALDAIVATFAPDAADVRRLDVRKLSVAGFAAALSDVSPAATLWTPGECDWLILGAKNGASNRLETAIERYADVETPFSLPELFANYAGTVAEVRPAFAALDPKAGVVPELFVTRDIPSWDWLDSTGVETDILARVAAEMRSMQVVRRVVFEGNIASRKGEIEKSVTAWSRARLRNPNDTLLLERVSHLRDNAEVFFKLGKFGMAGNCYETLIGIDPKDTAAMSRLAVCFRNLRKPKAAEAVENRLRALR